MRRNAALLLPCLAVLWAFVPSMTLAEEGKLVFSTHSFPPFSYLKDGRVSANR